jgi:hypothetical protein
MFYNTNGGDKGDDMYTINNPLWLRREYRPVFYLNTRSTTFFMLIQGRRRNPRASNIYTAPACFSISAG